MLLDGEAGFLGMEAKREEAHTCIVQIVNFTVCTITITVAIHTVLT